MTEDTQFETLGLQATSPPTSPLHRMPPFLKRKHDNLEEDDLMPSSPPQSPEDLQPTSTITSPDGSKRLRVDDDDKENVDNVKSIVISAKKSIPPPPLVGVQEDTCSSSSTSSTSSDDNDDSGIRDISEDDYLAANEDEDEEEEDDEKSEEGDDKPKVIVEHQPLPSIYELQQMTCENLNESNLDSGLSEDESGSDPEEDSEEESVESMISSPLFDPVLRGTPSKTPVITPPTPKVIYNDRFWNQGSFGAQNTPQPPATPPPHTAQPSSGGNPPFGFLESGQRIECAENGKSYLQLGTINHIPVTPVIQPKSNMVYRRPIPPFRTPQGGNQVHLQAARPVCDHSDCLQRKSSYCYKNQRSRMLNLSLHKLHLARQNHEGCLRRSVLICNMLRYIEDESEKEALQETLVPQQMDTTEQYWPSQHQSCSSSNTTQIPQGSPVTSSAYMQPQAASSISAHSGSAGSQDTYETALKDFNTAFRSTPYSSPLHPSSDSEMTGTTDIGLSLSLTPTTSSMVTPTSGSEDRSTGINWGSVLSLGSQSELDPLNNNSFNTEVSSWNSIASSSSSVTTSAVSSLPAVSSTTSTTLTTLSPLSGVTESGEDSLVHSFVDDIGWKLSADDVLKAFPT